MSSRAALLSLEQARRQLLASIAPLTDTEMVSLASALDRVAAADIAASIPVPPWDNAAMDGYALRRADLEQTPTLPVSQRVAAGMQPDPLQPGTAARIFTGAPVPDHADTVVMQENCEQQNGQVTVVQLPERGENIRRQGSDISAGSKLIEKGQRLGPFQLGLLASTGIDQVPVVAKPKVALLMTGDELVEPGLTLTPGKIFNSNQYVIQALCQRMGIDVVASDHVVDSLDATVSALSQAAEKANVIITMGGVSAGEEDHVKDAVSREGELLLWKLAIKPGKPFAFGRFADSHFFGLPGNPVSAVVTLLLLVRPALLKLMGAAETDWPERWVEAGFSRDQVSDREEYLRVSLKSTPEGDVVQPFSRQSSGVLSSLGQSDGLAVIPKGNKVKKGDRLRFLAFNAIF
ncbi:molybdopterin molybdenumtransferase MoeA [Pseudohongiella nitratireducens]|jgi:molybdopterin molybdotransferase|uniref:Molybdopterin molybdenumtransferase n=1 Tax=Pseudohongiella nitratireducens TaxID=1768907 RepID=A0A916QJZ0_9GAMM|nr:gephyrin-like molybdotransferase Glp [Pseudohongiella nitratireducens]GFZ78337.1 molybdopterin molybdenumtransferase MoeA [Pseudohongiella nitratireducens]